MHHAKTRATHTFRWQSIAALLRLGLHHFWHQALPSDSSLPEMLLEEARTLLGAESTADWKSLQRQVEQQWPPGSGTLARLINDYDLSLAETFLVTLLGEVERSHLISLVVRELQAPSTQARPTVHLCTALMDELFAGDEITALNLADSALVQAKIIRIDGDGPQPLHRLLLSAEFWSVLLERATVWPQCSLIPNGNSQLLPAAVHDQLPAMADLLAAGTARSLILRGQPNSGRQLLASELARQLGCRALSVPIEVWKNSPGFTQACRYAGWLPVLQPRLGPGEIWRPEGLLEKVPVLILLGTDGAVESRNLIELTMSLPTESQRRTIWQAALNNPALATQCAANAMLSGPSIATIAASATLLAQREQQPVTMHHITLARRQLGAERLRLLAQPVEREVDGNAIVLTPLVNEEMERIISRASQRESLWQGLGTTLQQTATSGIRALFIGESGTGKTLAASYLATRIGAPLYRVDLSAVMNKYIGESEKNLSALLDMAAASDVILLFDEADSLFGKRSEGKETGERFANMLTHFLLTRIENHPGIVILTSNNRERIDSAFTRRLDLIVDFPMPSFDERLKLWSSHLGERGPGEKVYRLLASYCDFSGGQLRNVVVTAAAEAGNGIISSRHLLAGVQAEYRKLGRDMPAMLNQLKNLDNQGN
ncbi:MAG TPA: ATP-binding protein [Chromatiales bacterium]|nr:ATP-binding protein [Chromatiales bacterium]